MCNSFQKSIAESYRSDLLDSIDMAKRGQLAPSKQEYCFGEIANAIGTDSFPTDGEWLLQQLKETLSGQKQISELENEILEVNAIGGELLFFYYLDRYTLLELMKHRDGLGFDSFVFICEKKHRDKIRETAAEMKAALDEWLGHCTYPHGDITARDQTNQTDFCRYGTLDEALTFLYTALNFPDSILT